MPAAKEILKYAIPPALLLLAFSCSSYKGIEIKNAERGELTRVKRVKVMGMTVSDKSEDIPSTTQLEAINNEKIKSAEADAKAKQALFKITTKQSREKMKQDTAKYLSWVCLGFSVVSIGIGVATRGYRRWATVAAAFFGVGMLALLVPELLDYIKWVFVCLGLIGIYLGMSHSKEWSVFKTRMDRDG